MLELMKMYVDLGMINTKMMWVDFQLWLYE
jgi:hypothetical protein